MRTDGETYRLDKANSRFSQFYERAQKLPSKSIFYSGIRNYMPYVIRLKLIKKLQTN